MNTAMHPPSVSVVIPVYNAQSHLAATCRSILLQSYPAIEVLLVDDQSRDGSHALALALAEEDDRIRVLQTPANCGGPAGPRNLGVNQARGDYVAFCDSDDLWMADKLVRQMQVIQQSGAAICSTRAKRFASEDQLGDTGTDRGVRWKRIGFIRNRIKNCLVTSSVVARREWLLRFPFNESPGYRAVEDYDCWLRIIRAAGFCAKLDQALVGYRISTSQISREKWQMIRKVFRVHWNFDDRLAKPTAPVFAATHASLGLAQRLFGLSV